MVWHGGDDGKFQMLIVRDARAEDMAAVAEIYQREVREGLATFEEEPPQEAEMARRWRSLVGDGFAYVVAERDGVVVGYAYVGPYRPRPAYRFCVESTVYVRKQARGSGVGRALVARLLEVCEAGPWRQIVAVIGDSDNAASIGLHAALGFEHRGVMRGVGFKLGRWVDTVVMQRALGDGDAELPN